jgi:hypothetical protein
MGYGDDSQSDSGIAQNGGYPAYAPDLNGPAGPPPGNDADYAQAPARPPYNPNFAPAPPPSPVPQSTADDRPGLKLIFWDLRPDQQVHDYLVTPKTLYVFDGGRRREIPLVDIDVVATRQANQESGIDFSVPAGN